jgi:hypothetical protein
MQPASPSRRRTKRGSVRKYRQFEHPNGAVQHRSANEHFEVLTVTETRARLAELYRRGFDLLTQWHASR